MDSNKKPEENSFYIKHPYDGETIFIKVPYNESTFFVKGDSNEDPCSPEYTYTDNLNFEKREFENKGSFSKQPNADCAFHLKPPYKGSAFNSGKGQCYSRNYNYLDKSILFIIALYFVSCFACREY